MRTIHMIEANPQWNARVVYGDTDSVFVLLKGRDRPAAFKIGREIANMVTSQNPNPVKLTLEKVYQPCCLISKKRYVGYKYESSDQMVPKFDAKGIETVRRDGFPLQAEALEKVIRMLFETKDISKVRGYLEQLWNGMLMESLPLEKFIFAKEVRMGTYRMKPPAALVAEKAIAKDPRREPLYNERIRYVVVRGPPKARLMDRVVEPAVVLRGFGDKYRIDSEYYITKLLNKAVARITNLVGVDVHLWYQQLKRPRVARRMVSGQMSKNTLLAFYASRNCLVCGTESNHPYFCDSCRADAGWLIYELLARKRAQSNSLQQIRRKCRDCAFAVHDGESSCISLDCATMYLRRLTLRKTLFLQEISRLFDD